MRIKLKPEYFLGLIGFLLAAVAFVLSITDAVVESTLRTQSSIVSAIIMSILLLAAVILGFVGTSRIRKGKSGGGILLVVAGGLSFIAPFAGLFLSWFSFFAFPLFLTGGIIALCRKNGPSS